MLQGPKYQASWVQIPGQPGDMQRTLGQSRTSPQCFLHLRNTVLDMGNSWCTAWRTHTETNISVVAYLGF